MSKAFEELRDSIRQCIEYEKGNHSEAQKLPNLVSKSSEENFKLHIKETNNSHIEYFEEFPFNPENNWRYIYNDVVDKIVEKYWYTDNRKETIENKVYEFYKKFKMYNEVQEAYVRFLRSNRLFED